jgi:hypothetical protein
MRAIALHGAPLPVDPIARQAQQQELFLASEALRVALDRSRHRIPILDVESDVPPYWIVSRGPAFVGDWRSAVALRKELEQIAREMADG